MLSVQYRNSHRPTLPPNSSALVIGTLTSLYNHSQWLLLRTRPYVCFLPWFLLHINISPLQIWWRFCVCIVVGLCLFYQHGISKKAKCWAHLKYCFNLTDSKKRSYLWSAQSRVQNPALYFTY